MKKLLLMGGLFLMTSAFASITNAGFSGILITYNDIVSAISTGKTLHIVTNYALCTTAQKLTAATPISMASVTPEEIGVNDNSVFTSTTHFTMIDPFFPDKPVKEYVRYVITPDGYMDVMLQVLDAATYSSLMNPITFTCKINVATKIYD